MSTKISTDKPVRHETTGVVRKQHGRLPSGYRPFAEPGQTLLSIWLEQRGSLECITTSHSSWNWTSGRS